MSSDRQQRRKYRRVTAVEKALVNPMVRTALDIGVAPKTFAMLEHVGRKSGKVYRTPVGNGLIDGVFWLVSEHGAQADYVKNITANPDVRIKIGRRWYTGHARVLPDDDALARSKAMPHKFDAALARRLGSDLLTVRVDLTDG